MNQNHNPDIDTYNDIILKRNSVNFSIYELSNTSVYYIIDAMLNTISKRKRSPTHSISSRQSPSSVSQSLSQSPSSKSPSKKKLRDESKEKDTEEYDGGGNKIYTGPKGGKYILRKINTVLKKIYI